jgi:hypothetical protein
MTMKKVLMVLVAAMLMMGMATGAQAFEVGGTYTLTNSTVQFYLVDYDMDNTITMTIFATLGIENLKYSLDSGANWSSFGSNGFSDSLIINPSNSGSLLSTHTQLMYLSFSGDVTADMVFQTRTANTMPNNLDLFTNLNLFFSGINNGGQIAILSESGPDKVAPVPVPPAVYLLGAGLIGLVGLRKRFNK